MEARSSSLPKIVEGLRLLPWIQEAARRAPEAVATYLDCEKCMQTNPLEIRRALGCGFAPRLEGARPWSPAGLKGAAPALCVGYTATLPEVLEIARARFHWDKGALALFCGDDKPTELLLQGIELLSGSTGECSDYWLTPASKGGGGPG